VQTIAPWRTRFAPSPTGLLHVGNAYSALCCLRWVEQHQFGQHQAELLLRIEDIDHTRCKPEYADAIIDDLTWLGLQWQQDIRFQSQCSQAYQQAILQLRNMQMIYPCFCSRKQIREEITRMASAPHSQTGEAEYPGICRGLPHHEQQQRMQHEAFAWRLYTDKAMSIAISTAGHDLSWREESGQQHAVHVDHDVIIGRKDIDFSYHLAVVVDDGQQGISHIIRGQDLAASTAIHRVLQVLLGLPEPIYIHHPLLCGNDAQKLSKRNGSMSLKSLRHMGVDAQQLRNFLSDAKHPHWPFSKQDKPKILAMLGNWH